MKRMKGVKHTSTEHLKLKGSEGATLCSECSNYKKDICVLGLEPIKDLKNNSEHCTRYSHQF